MVNIDPKIFKSYDIRATYPEQINEENVYIIAQAVYKFLLSKFTDKSKLKIALGRDMRLSGPALFPIIVKALVEAGADVIDIGLVSTPTLYFAVFHYGYDAGIQLSASHNPSNYNGMKIVRNTGSGLMKIGKTTGMDEIRNIALSMPKITSNIEGSVIKNNEVLKDEIANAKTVLDLPKINKFKVVCDAGNGMGSQYVGELFKQLDSELIKMNFDLDGSFPVHIPDPLVAANLKDLQVKVISEKADLGIAPDGDGDRVFFTDEKGQVIPASVITALVTREMLHRYPGSTILFDIRYTLTAKKTVEEMGGKYEITKVGHAFITETMNKTGAVFGGESSGHYFFKATGNAESQIPIILIVMAVMSREGKPISQIVSELARSHESGEYNFKTDKATEIIDGIKDKYNDGDVSTLDGVSVEYEDWRFGVRSSNTEPLLRLNLESTSNEMMKEKLNELIEFIKSYGAEIHTGEH